MRRLLGSGRGLHKVHVFFEKEMIAFYDIGVDGRLYGGEGRLEGHV